MSRNQVRRIDRIALCVAVVLGIALGVTTRLPAGAVVGIVLGAMTASALLGIGLTAREEPRNAWMKDLDGRHCDTIPAPAMPQTQGDPWDES